MTERSLAEELMVEIQSIQSEMTPKLHRHGDALQLAARRELRIQHASAVRLHALFAQSARAV